VLAEAAEKLITSVIPWWSDTVRRRQLIAAQAHFNSHGITSAVSGAVRPSDAALLRDIVDGGDATLRLSLMLSPTGELNPSIPLDRWEAYFERLGPPTDGADPWLSHAAVKLQIDGGMTLRTAATRTPYPGTTDYYGECVVSQERLDAFVAVANRAGWRVGVHAVGEAGIDKVLDAFERADQERSIRDRRFILVHASLMLPDQMERARDLGVRADIQSVFLWSKAEMIRKHLGDAVADRAIPTRQLIDILGIDNVASGTDFPINPLNPFINLYLLVTRRDVHGRVNGADQAITREEAIRLYTTAAARYTFSEGEKGSLEAGKLADLVVISDDILSVPEDAIKDIVAELTIVDGKPVFDRNGLLDQA
jgi:predicted amidohydrolase YtcJ